MAQLTQIEVNGVTYDIADLISGFVTASVNNLANYYLKSETYTKAEVAALIGAIQQFHYEIYESRQDVTSPASNVLYLIGPTGIGADKYEEYVYDSTKQDPWVKIGDTSIDLSDYVTEAELNEALSSKVDKVPGKGLSENDYTDAEKDKVALLSSDSVVVDARLADTLVGQPDSIVLQVKRKSGSTTTITEFDLASYYVQKEQGKGLVSDAEKATWNGKYSKPGTGIPKTDLAQGVQDSLGAADTAYQKPASGIPASDLASGVIPDVSNFITKSVDDLVNYYLKSETYTKTEVQNLIAAINQFHYEIYASTSAVTDPASNVLYLIGPTGTGADKYEEYVYDSTKQDPWVKIGDTSIDLSGYVTTTALNTALADYTTTANLTTLLAGKQDTIADLSDIRNGSQYNVKYDVQALTTQQKAQARANIGAGTYDKPSTGIPASDMEAGVIPDAVEANPTVPSGTTPTPLTGLKVGSSYYSAPNPTALSNNDIDTIWTNAMS